MHGPPPFTQPEPLVHCRVSGDSSLDVNGCRTRRGTHQIEKVASAIAKTTNTADSPNESLEAAILFAVGRRATSSAPVPFRRRLRC
jgi:hypothetical protein